MMWPTPFARLAFALGALALLAPGCTGQETQGGQDAATTDAPVADALLDAAEEFPLRTPQARDLSCPGGTMTFTDADFFCRVPIDDASIDLYVQATPTECVSTGMSTTPVFGDVHGWYRDDETGPVRPTAAAYVWGGNHHNDEIKFVWQTTTYDLWHSSIGFGWRACAPPDCLLVCDAGATFETCDSLDGWVVDGCDRESGGPPPLSRVICVAVTASGEVPPLEDPWTTDPPLLPCPGDL